MSIFENSRVLITGGTGSFGKSMVRELIRNHNCSEILIYSRDELKQFELSNDLNASNLNFQIGDVRDFQRISDCMQGVDFVIHAAAMKQIPASEDNPMEAIKTNILGADNVVHAAILNNVKKVMALSTDKAANPANLYGSTKLCSDKLMIQGNKLGKTKGTSFSVVRYGNVLGSRGSVIPFFLEKAKGGTIPITHEAMTRFWITIDQAVQFVIKSITSMQGGEIFVPKIPSFKVVDVAQTIAPGIPIEIIGIRPGEKLHEIMITEDDSSNTLEFEDHFLIIDPTQKNEYPAKDYKKVYFGFKFSSDSNSLWFTQETFQKLLVENKILEH
jgi:UDP-N-acetylglucosamine 4,6-dehydratase